MSKRERYTERNRPHRRSVEPGERGGDGGGLDNPVVIVSLAGLVLAVVLAIGFVFGQGQQEATPPGASPQELLADANATATAMAGGADTRALEIGGEDAPPTLDASASGDEAAGAAAEPTAGAYSEPEDQALDPESTAYFATIETAYGPVKIELWPEIAPQHVNSFIFLAREGFYDGLTFHRVVSDFVIQGGDPTGTGQGGPGYSVPAEFNADDPVPHRAGTLAMARTQDPNSAGSQFYIVTADGPSAQNLTGSYTNFGHVVEGMEHVRQIQQGDVMQSITIEEAPKGERVVSPDDIRAGELPQDVVDAIGGTADGATEGDETDGDAAADEGETSDGDGEAGGDDSGSGDDAGETGGDGEAGGDQTDE